MTNGIQPVKKFGSAVLSAFSDKAGHNSDYIFIRNSVFLVYTVIIYDFAPGSFPGSFKTSSGVSSAWINLLATS